MSIILEIRYVVGVPHTTLSVADPDGEPYAVKVARTVRRGGYCLLES